MRTVEIAWEEEKAYLASLRDITEHKRMLAELEQTRQQDLLTKDVFLSKVSHELRSPLSVIHQFTTIMLDGLSGELSEEQLEHLSIIGRNVDELRAMIDDLLQMTKTEINEIFKASPHKPGTINLISESVPLKCLVEEVQSMLRTIAAQKQIRLEAAVPHDLPHAHADPHRVKQVMIRRIQGQLRQCARLQESDLSFAISPVTRELLDKDNPLPYERQLGIVVDTLENLIKEKTNQRRGFNGKKENTCG